MSSTLGDKIKISVFGESHGKAIGVVIDGLPSGKKIDMEKVYCEMKRRAPGNDKTSTPRKEADSPVILSGILNGTTTGAPLAIIIRNTNTKSGDYQNILSVPRPGHSDYPAFVKYNGYNDISGGGHFSGRLTAPITFAGAICKQFLEDKGIFITSHIKSIGNIEDMPFNPVNIEKDIDLGFPLLDKSKEEPMRKAIADTAFERDSLGGTVECAVEGMPAGFGGPLFGGIEGKLSYALFGIPAVKGVEFGKGFELSKMKGSESNDSYYFDGESIKTHSNNCGGISGGISNGMPIVFTVALKPTPSIAKEQQSVDLVKKVDTTLSVKGRHDPCIVLRACPVVEAVTAITILDLLS
ncbi:MAG: chorismate synthase [Acutalibacteraceae bacterium]